MVVREEPTQMALDCEAQGLRVGSGFKLSIDEARDRVAQAEGWVGWAHMLKCKAVRDAP